MLIRGRSHLPSKDYGKHDGSFSDRPLDNGSAKRTSSGRR